MRKGTWRCSNLSTGSVLEANDLGFILEKLQGIDKLEFKPVDFTDLIMRGKVEFTAKNDEGENNSVVIEDLTY